MDTFGATPIGRPRLTAFGRAARTDRIFERLRQGWSYEAVASAERLSEKRVRKIVSDALGKRDIDGQADHALLQMTRLAPAMQVAAEAVAKGDVKAIPQLLRVLDRFDRYTPSVRAGRQFDALERKDKNLRLRELWLRSEFAHMAPPFEDDPAE